MAQTRKSLQKPICHFFTLSLQLSHSLHLFPSFSRLFSLCVCYSEIHKHLKFNFSFICLCVCAPFAQRFFFVGHTEFASLQIQTEQSQLRQHDASDGSQINLRETKAVTPPPSNCPRTCPVLTSPQEPVCGSDDIIYANSCEMKKKTCIRNGAANVKVNILCLAFFFHLLAVVVFCSARLLMKN